MSDKPFFLSANEGFSEATEADELLHPKQNATIEGDSLTETQYLGFNIPEHNIHGLGYIWHHPNLGVLTGGVMAWQGIKPYSVAAELFDIRAYHSDRVLEGDLHKYTLDNSYSVEVKQPLKHLHMNFNDEQRANHIDLDFTAITPPVMFGDGNHFEQGLKVEGSLVLRGKEYQVNGYNVRDRSWGKLRPENNMPIPPVSWMTGLFGDDLVFNCALMDHVGSTPDATGSFAIPVEHALTGGWISREGEITRIVKAHKKVERAQGNFLPLKMVLVIEDENGWKAQLNGRLLASCPWAVWPNINSNISLMEWDLDGRKGHGDCQDVLWTDYVHANCQ